MWDLPNHLRNTLKEPIGHIFNETDLINYIQTKKFIITIGDHVTYTLLKYDITPTIIIIDYFCKRKPLPSPMKKKIKSYGNLILHTQNPPGKLTNNLWNTIKEALQRLNEAPIRIEVEGEEDMASLAVIALAPEDATVIYGLPNKGVIAVNAKEIYKQKVKQVLDKM